MIQNDNQTTTRPGKEIMPRSARAGTSARPGSSSLRMGEDDDDQFNPSAPATEGDLSRIIEALDRQNDELANQR